MSRAPRTLIHLLLPTLLVAASVPLAAVSGAENDPGQADGLVVVAHPRAASVTDNGVVMTALGNQYVFDFSLFTAEGAPYLVKSYMVDVNTIRQEGGNGPGEAATLVWTETVNLATATNSGTVRIPAWRVMATDGNADTNFAGFTLTILPRIDAQGLSLVDADGHLPAGQYSLAANELADAGRWAEADVADEGFTPVLGFAASLDDVVEPGNPLLNGGFELPQMAQPGADAPVAGARLAAPGWYLYLNKVANDQTDSTQPASVGNSGSRYGSEGMYYSIKYNTSDDGKNLGLHQRISAPAGSAWVGTSSVKAEFDIAVSDAAGIMPKLRMAANVFHSDSGSSVKPVNVDGASVPTDYAWHHVVIDFGSQLEGKNLTQFYLNFASGTKYSGSEVFHPGAKLNIKLDNVKITGAQLISVQPPESDLNDGFSTFIVPYGATAPVPETVNQNLAQLADGKLAYAYEVAVMDYASGAAQSVDLAGLPFAFRLLDERSPPGGATEKPELFEASGTLGEGRTFRFLEADGTLSDRILVLADADLLDASGVGGEVGEVVPWLFVDVATGDEHTEVYGSMNPTSGYYSIARNALMASSVADQLDYAATPLGLSGEAGPSLVATPTLALVCPDAEQGSSCVANPEPEVAIRLTGGSRVLEDVTVTLFSVLDPETPLGTGTVSGPTGEVLVRISDETLAAMEAAGEYAIYATSGQGIFTEPATSNVLKLDNFLPVADYAQSVASGITTGTPVTFTDASTDSDGTIVSRTWTIRLVSDEFDQKIIENGSVVRGGTGGAITFQATDDGLYSVKLDVVDNDGGVASKTSTFDVANLGPKATLRGPTLVALGTTLPYVDASTDSDGLVAASVLTTDNGMVGARIGNLVPVTFASEGVATLTLAVTDDDLATDSTTLQVVVDGTAPVTNAVAEALPASGWYTGDVDILVSRSDAGGAGVAFTRVLIDGQETLVNGTDAFTVTVTGDGEHTVSIRSVDAAGNVEADAIELVIAIDGSAPETSVFLPGSAGPLAVFLAGEEVEVGATATDSQSPVEEVRFYVDGALLGVDTDGTDGFNAVWDTTGVTTGTHVVRAEAVNAAGLVSAAEATAFVVGLPF